MTWLDASVDVEDLAEVFGDRAVVGIRGHDIPHIAPPLLADRLVGDAGPLRLVLDFGVGEELMRVGVKEDRVVADAVRLEDSLQFGPDRRVPRFSYSTCWSGLTDMTNALRIIVILLLNRLT